MLIKKGPAKNVSFQPLHTILQTIKQTSNFAQPPRILHSPGLYVCPPGTLMLVKEITNEYIYATLPCSVSKLLNYPKIVQLQSPASNIIFAFCQLHHSSAELVQYKVCPTCYHFYRCTYHHYNS